MIHAERVNAAYAQDLWAKADYPARYNLYRDEEGKVQLEVVSRYWRWWDGRLIKGNGERVENHHV